MAVVACKTCGKEIGKGVKKCVHCGADQRNFFAKHKIITGILALVVFGVVVAQLGGGGSSDASSTATTPTTGEVQPAANKEEAPTAAKIGDPLKVGDLVFTVSSSDDVKELKSPLGNKSGNWIVVAVKVENKGKEAVMIDGSFFKLIDSAGATYETDSDNLVYLDSEQNFFLDNINPNMSKEGKVLFAVPDGLKDVKLQVQTGAFGTETGEIALSK